MSLGGSPPTHSLPEPKTLEGFSGRYVAYSFPEGSSDVELKEKIGFATSDQGPFRCCGCRFYSLGFCRRYHIRVGSSDCCASYQKR